MKRNSREKLWIVVEVESGIAVDAKAYSSESAAVRRMSRRGKTLNLQDDDVQVFQVHVPNR